jgi:hypothetical protein
MVQERNTDREESEPYTGDITQTYLEPFDPVVAAEDAFYALVAVDPDPDVNLYPQVPGLGNEIGGYSYTAADNAGSIGYAKYYFYVQGLGNPAPNYIKIVWDIGRYVTPNEGNYEDYSFAEVLETDKEYVFRDVLNYGEATDPRRYSDVYSWLEHLQAEASPIVTNGDDVHFCVCNVRIYRSPSSREYLTQGFWIDAGVLTIKPWGYES